MRIYQVKAFVRFAKKNGISAAMLRDCVADAEVNPTAVLGAGLVKQRMARPGGGKSGGYRTVLYLRNSVRAIFAYGFAKNERDNIAKAEVEAFKEAAQLFLNFSDEAMAEAVTAGKLVEVPNGDEED